MRLKYLKQELSKINEISKPDIKFEQYNTPIDIAASMISMANDICSFNNKIVADFGCGSGILAIASSFFEPSAVFFIDLDSSCLELSKNNVDICIGTDIPIEFIKIDFEKNLIPFVDKKMFDIVVMNPPFGTKNNSGIDVKFLTEAFKYTSQYVFSLHKSSTRKFILKTAKDMGIDATVISQINYNLDKSYKFHKKNSVDINVDLIQFKC